MVESPRRTSIFGASFLFAQAQPVSETVSGIGQKLPRMKTAEDRAEIFMSVSLSAIFIGQTFIIQNKIVTDPPKGGLFLL